MKTFIINLRNSHKGTILPRNFEMQAQSFEDVLNKILEDEACGIDDEDLKEISIKVKE